MSPTMSEVEQAVSTALRGRLAIALDVLGHEDDGTVDELAARLGAVAAGDEPGVAWLAFTAFYGRFPTELELARLRRELILQTDPIQAFLVTGATIDRRGPAALRDLKIVADRPVIDVGHAATSDHATGIQRVIRQTIPHWSRRRIELVAWHADEGGWRDLDGTERERVGVAPDEPATNALIVPWRTTVILPEVSSVERASTLAALAAGSGSRVAIIGYDLIPVVSAELVDQAEAERMGQFLAVVKSAAVVAGISESAASEFRGFAHALAAQGSTGPEIVAVPLAEAPVPSVQHERAEADPPLILCVGSHEPRKNQATVLAAAIRLHAEGVAFRLVFVGGGSRVRIGPFDLELERLRREGVPVSSERLLDDAGLAALYDAARCTVMISLHEGFGLPVVESLSRGVPVLTSDHGSLAEVAASGGCVTVDATDVEAVTAALRELVTDDELIARLRAEAAARPPRSWREYADELWDALVGGAR